MGVFRSTYLPWIDSITRLKAGEKEEIELRLNGNYENVWRVSGSSLSLAGITHSGNIGFLSCVQRGFRVAMPTVSTRFFLDRPCRSGIG